MANHVTPDKQGRLSLRPFMHPELNHTHYRVDVQPDFEIRLIPMCSIGVEELDTITRGMIKGMRAGVITPEDVP